MLFRAEEDHPLEQELPFDLGWGQFAGALTVKLLPGAHAGLLEEPGMFLPCCGDYDRAGRKRIAATDRLFPRLQRFARYTTDHDRNLEPVA